MTKNIPGLWVSAEFFFRRFFIGLVIYRDDRFLIIALGLIFGELDIWICKN